MSIPREWLVKKGSRGVFEEERLSHLWKSCGLDEARGRKYFGDQPFGELQRDWEAFVGVAEEGDEIWEYSYRGRGGALVGYCILRGKVEVAVMQLGGIPRAWWQTQVTAKQEEEGKLQCLSEHLSIPLEKLRAKYDAKPGGIMGVEWNLFVGQMEEGDELWWYSSGVENKSGTGGYIIVCNDRVVDVYESFQC